MLLPYPFQIIHLMAIQAGLLAHVPPENVQSTLRTVTEVVMQKLPKTMESIVQKDFLTAKAEKRIRQVLLAFVEMAGLQRGADMEAGAGTGLGQLAVKPWNMLLACCISKPQLLHPIISTRYLGCFSKD